MSQLIFSKMNAVMKDIKAVGKDQKNTAQGFSFRGIDQFVNALYPALTKHGVFMTTETVHHKSELKDVTRSNGKPGVDKHISLVMKYTFWAEDGSSVSSMVPAEGLDSGDKGTNKALSAALKYALIQTFSIPTTDMAEADFETPEIGVSALLPTSAVVTSVPPTLTNVATAESTLVVSSPKRSSFRKPAAKAASTPEATPASNGSALGF